MPIQLTVNFENRNYTNADTAYRNILYASRRLPYVSGTRNELEVKEC